MSKELNHEMRAYTAWDILVEWTKTSSTITYKELADRVGVHSRACKYFLEHIENYCIEQKLPPLTSIVVNHAGEIGQGFTEWDTDNLRKGQQLVYDFKWGNYLNPFAYAANDDTQQDLIKEIINGEGSQALYTKVKVKGIAQKIFRSALLKAYDSKCAFCNFKIPHALEAAHIVPWSESSDGEKLDIQNGVLLCSNHHKLFDNNIYYINSDLTIGINGYKSRLQDQKISLPKNKDHWPREDFLTRRTALSHSK
ncbi:HNH endonuclease [Virgibacillus sp. DJP39]|uniref:HNH endonuclease n=1 Tax=Virgibacillus sp. DJP39 TaxID=3409790 RepID=UPI003BB58F26